MMEMLIFCGAVAAICGMAGCYGARGALAGILFVVWGVLLLNCFITPPVTWLFLFGFAVLAGVLAAAVLKSRRVAVVALLATLGAGVTFGAMWRTRSREIAALVEQYPAVSVADRLAYETGGRQQAPGRFAEAAADVQAASDDQALPDPIEWELKRVEGRLRDWSADDGWRVSRRPYALARLSWLHGNMVDRFTISQGFGVSRMRPIEIRRETIEIPDLPALAAPEIPEPDYGDVPRVVAGAGGENAPAMGEELAVPDRADLRTAHESSVVDFSNRAGFGYVASREQVFGFQPHGFRTLPDIGGASDTNSRWRVASLELVSLLKHETPAAYVSKNLPRMDELAAAPTRPLDEFENDALRQLRSGEELVIEERADELRMLGSLRAAKQCTECHAVSRGDLLGAFTYRLRRDDSPRRRPPPPVKPVS